MPKNQAKTNATINACGGPDSSSSPRYDPIKGRNFGSQVTLRHMRCPYRFSSLRYDNPSGRVPIGDYSTIARYRIASWSRSESIGQPNCGKNHQRFLLAIA
jgi:hypothetical protein